MPPLPSFTTKPPFTFSVLPFTPSTFLLAYDCVSEPTVSPPTSPLAAGVPADAVVPSYTFESVTAFSDNAFAVITPVAAGANVTA